MKFCASYQVSAGRQFSASKSPTSCSCKTLKIDDRYHIEEFANYTNLKQSLLDLKALAETENWDYLKKPTRGVPVLFSYLNQTCIRLIKQDKIARGKSTKDKMEYAYFNTGLVTPQQDEIFAYFIKNPNYSKLTGWGVQSAEWNFIEFNTEQSVYRRYFIEVPEIATYFSEAEVADLIFDTRVPIIPDKEHLLKRKIEWAAANSTFAIGGVSCSADSFVVAESSVLRT
jgi:hypothetical protein